MLMRAIHQHSVEPPLLVNYEESGLPYWTFGGSTVVANNYIRLTPASGAGAGYLWNRHPAQIGAWETQFTVRRSARLAFNLFGSGVDCPQCGIGFWHLDDAARHGQNSFFGVPPAFSGIGVVLASADGSVHVVRNDGATVNSLNEVSLGSCKHAVTDVPVTFMVRYSNETRQFTVTIASGQVKPGVARQEKPCVSLSETELGSRFYFGFSALTRTESGTGYDVLNMAVSGAEKAQPTKLNLHERDESHPDIVDDTQLMRMRNRHTRGGFNHAAELAEQKQWTGAEDSNPHAPKNPSSGSGDASN
jgi:hypothetical protein